MPTLNSDEYNIIGPEMWNLQNKVTNLQKEMNVLRRLMNIKVTSAIHKNY